MVRAEYQFCPILPFLLNSIIVGSTTITLAMALTYDAVRVIAETTNFLPYQPQQLNCSERHDNVQPDGSTFKNYMRSVKINWNQIIAHFYIFILIFYSWTFWTKQLRDEYFFKAICARDSALMWLSCSPWVWWRWAPGRRAKTLSLSGHHQ